MGCCSIWNADTKVLFPAGVNLSKNPGDAGDLFVVFLSPRDSGMYNATSQRSEYNQ